MKKLLLTVTLVAAVATAYGQGSINFSGSILNKLSTRLTDGTGLALVPTAPGLMEYGIFYGVGTTLPATLNLWTGQFGVNSTTATGMIANPSDGKSLLNNVPLGAETSPGETDVWIKVGAWSGSFGTDWQKAQAAFAAGEQGVAFGFSQTVNLGTLGNPTISGAAIWQAATATNPKLLQAFVIPVNVVPEPSTMALAGLGVAAMMILRRRK